MADNILDDVTAAAAELAGETPQIEQPQEQEQQALEQEKPSGDRARDEQGRFKPASEMKPRPKEPRETLTLPKDKAEQPTLAKPAEQAKEPPLAPPADWKGGGKIDWNRLPRAIQGELMERFNALESARQEVAPVKEIIDVNREFLVNEAGSVQGAFQQLIQMARMANTVDGSIQLAQYVLQRRGIDPRRVFGGQPQGQVPGSQPTPDINSLIDRVVQQRLQPFQAQIEQRETQQIEAEVSAFRADPKHPFFEDVRQQMGQLLKAGIAADMQDAYEKAVKLNPAISAQLDQQRQQEAEKERQAKVEQARRAGAANLRGAPLPNASSGKGNPNASVHDDVRAALAEITGA